MVQLRVQVRQDADETIDYDEYADEVKLLIDKHIAGVEVKEPDGVYQVDKLGKNSKPEDLSDDEARNQTDKITGRITKMIEQDLADDPYAQEYFSKLLQKAIEDAKAMFDAPVKQYMLFSEFEQEVKNRVVDDIPEDFKNNHRAQAYFGLFKHLFKGELALAEESLIKYSFEIDEVVNKAVAEYSINPSEIENAVTTGLLPMLYGDLGIDKAQLFIAEVIKITRLGIARAQ
jgi:type I restriction enzyme R subunit